MNYTINALNQAWQLPAIMQKIQRGLESGAVVVEVKRPNRTRDQEAKYHAMFADFAKQIELYGNKYRAEVWKALLVEQFAREREANGDPLRHPGETVVSLDGRRTITVRPSTTDFLKAEAAEFIEFLYQQGAELGVKWSEPALAAYGSYREAI